MTDLILPAVLSSELDAVNILIACLGESPVSTLSPSPSVDVDKALGALNEAMRDVQSRGWQWNKETAYPLSPDSNGNLFLPSNTLDCVAAYYIPGNSPSTQQPYEMVARGEQLYDQYNHTYTFTQGITVYVDLILLLEWSLIPQQARSVIAYEAAKKFIAREALSGVTAQVNENDVKQAWARLEQKEDREAQHNLLYGNLDTYAKIMGNGSLRRTRRNG